MTARKRKCRATRQEARKAALKKRQGDYYRDKRKGSFEKRLLDCIYGARARAKRRGFDCTIEVDQFQPQTLCKALPHVTFDFSNDQRGNPTSMSIDRLDPSKGYTVENCWLICYRANRIKNDATFEEFEMIYFAWKAERERRGLL